MSSIAPIALRAYQAVTTPFRKWKLQQLRNAARVPVAGLFLHRIADDHPNDWSMPTAVFDQLLDWLQQQVDLVSMAEAQRRLRDGNTERVAVHLSFDDGYADNCLHAIPELLKRKIPFTYFVTTANVESGKPFPHDVQQRTPLAPNSIDEIKAMADAGVEIGAHTRTHPDVASLAKHEDLQFEIDGARHDLEMWTGIRPRYFAFPYGLPHNINPRSVQHVYDCGFAGYCSAHGGFNFPAPLQLDDNVGFHLRRFHGDLVLARVQNWLTLDPRWLKASWPSEYHPLKQLDHNTTPAELT